MRRHGSSRRQGCVAEALGRSRSAADRRASTPARWPSLSISISASIATPSRSANWRTASAASTRVEDDAELAPGADQRRDLGQLHRRDPDRIEDVADAMREEIARLGKGGDGDRQRPRRRRARAARRSISTSSHAAAGPRQARAPCPASARRCAPAASGRAGAPAWEARRSNPAAAASDRAGVPAHARGGAQGRDRTTDTVIFSHVLYQLSYLGIRVRAGRPGQASGLPNRRPRRCPPSRDRPAGRGCDSLRRAISAGRGPCSRGCRRARDRAPRACRTGGSSSTG